MARQIKRFLHSELKHVSEWTYVLIRLNPGNLCVYGDIAA